MGPVIYPVGTIEHDRGIARRQRPAVQAGAQERCYRRVLWPLTGPPMQARPRQQPKSTLSELLPQAPAVMSSGDWLSGGQEIGELAAKEMALQSAIQNIIAARAPLSLENTQVDRLDRILRPRKLDGVMSGYVGAV